MVARAIMHRPAILFLDEPTAGLDPQSRIALWEILGELHGDGQTILLTTHYMEEADELCDRLAIIDHGQLLALDTPAELKRSIGVDTMVTVSADRRPRPARRGAARPRSPGASRSTRVDSTVLVEVRAQQGVLPAVIDAAERNGFDGHRPLRRPSRRSRPSSSTSPGRTCANDRRHRSPAHPTALGSSTRTPLADRAGRVPGAAPARPRRAAQDAQGVPAPHAAAAVPARLRVHVRVPEDRPGRRRRRRGASRVLDPARRRRRRARDHVPGHPVGRAADGAGVRLHARDRGPRARADAGRAGRDREGDLGRAQRAVRRAARVPDRGDRPGHARSTSTSTGWCCSRSRRSPATCAARSA